MIMRERSESLLAATWAPGLFQGAGLSAACACGEILEHRRKPATLHSAVPISPTPLPINNRKGRTWSAKTPSVGPQPVLSRGLYSLLLAFVAVALPV